MGTQASLKKKRGVIDRLRVVRVRRGASSIRCRSLIVQFLALLCAPGVNLGQCAPPPSPAAGIIFYVGGRRLFQSHSCWSNDACATIDRGIKIYHFWATIRRERVDEGRKCCFFLAIKMKGRTVVGRGRRARYVTPDLSYYWEGRREQCEDNKNETKKMRKKRLLF